VDSGVSANEATEGRVAPFSMRPGVAAEDLLGDLLSDLQGCRFAE